MPKTVNIPIQLISACSTIGRITPMIFRYENDEHQIIKVTIIKIINCKENHYAGIQENIYTCSAEMDGKEKVFNLKYNILQHKWTLFQMIT